LRDGGCVAAQTKSHSPCANWDKETPGPRAEPHADSYVMPRATVAADEARVPMARDTAQIWTKLRRAAPLAISFPLAPANLQNSQKNEMRPSPDPETRTD